MSSGLPAPRCLQIGPVFASILLIEQIAVGDADAALRRLAGIVGHLGHLAVSSSRRTRGADQIAQPLAGERVAAGWQRGHRPSGG